MSNPDGYLMSKEKTISGFYYPNKMGRIVLLSLEEIIGTNAVKAILNQAGSGSITFQIYPPNDLNKQFGFEELSQTQVALEQVFGPRGGRGIGFTCRTGVLSSMVCENLVR